MIEWEPIETVLLDMDGTLLDLNFDNYFWQEHVPRRYAERHGLALEDAKNRLGPRFDAVRSTMDWYCVDYWSRALEMDIALLKEEVAHLIAVQPHVLEFLEAVRRSGRRAVLVTNAHHKSLALKLRRTPLGRHLDAVVCAHDIGVPKEQPVFWRRLQTRERYRPAHTLLIDDNLAVLRAARDCGIRELLAVLRPDTRRGPLDTAEFPALHSFLDLRPPPRANDLGGRDHPEG